MNETDIIYKFCEENGTRLILHESKDKSSVMAIYAFGDKQIYPRDGAEYLPMIVKIVAQEKKVEYFVSFGIREGDLKSMAEEINKL